LKRLSQTVPTCLGVLGVELGTVSLGQLGHRAELEAESVCITNEVDLTLSTAPGYSPRSPGSQSRTAEVLVLAEQGGGLCLAIGY
jgi:hypothetical protein